MRIQKLAPWLATALLLGCGAQDRRNIVEDPQCSTGLRWAGSHAPNEVAPWDDFHGEHVQAVEMHPGGRCIGCHQADEGPDYVVAGTVFAKLHEPMDCFGRPNVEVQITDARQRVFKLRTNGAGNFFLKRGDAPGFQFPIRAEIHYDGRKSAMFPEQKTGDCNACHTREGTNIVKGDTNAPGHICADPDDPLCNVVF